MTLFLMDTLSVFHCDPVPVSEFDESDLTANNPAGALSSLSNSNSNININNQYVPIIRQSVLIASLLEQLCSLYETDKIKSQRLYTILCGQLSKLGIISPVAHLQEFSSVHTQYKQTLYNILQSSIMKLDAKPASFPQNCDLQKMLNPEGKHLDCKPLNLDPEKVFDFDTSRYRQEFIEKEKIGSGGYGSVYHTQSKIDGQEYAIKKIYLRSSLDESSSGLLREVHILAGLRHKNIVRYHSAWIEHVGMKSDVTAHSNDDDDSFCEPNVDIQFVSLARGIHDNELLLEETSGELSQSNVLVQPFFEYSGNQVKLDSGEKLQKQSSKFWKNSTASESSGSAITGSKNSNIHFSISPQSSDDELVFQDTESQIKFDDSKCITKGTPASPPKEVILTHGVRRDMKKDLHRVQSFIYTNDEVGTGEFNSLIEIKSMRFRAKSWSKFGNTDSGQPVAVAIPTKNPVKFPNVLGKTGLVLYIQMELCQTSLKRWLSVRNKNISQDNEIIHEGTSLHIMRQVVSALQFIHSKNLIHRDVKPPNIFLNNNNIYKPNVLLGDFGLAKKDFSDIDETTHRQNHPTLRRVDSHTSGVGTTTYAAPEQLTAEIYDAKVDMYSFGIVTYELWTVFRTAMERARQIKQLRDHIIPSEFLLKFPQLGRLVTSLLDHDPKIRPSSSEICNGDFFEKSKDKIIEEQTEKIEVLESQNRELKIKNKILQQLLNNK